MPTGKMIFAGGLSPLPINAPYIPGNPRGVRDGANSAGTAGGNAPQAAPGVMMDYGTEHLVYYAGIVPEIAKANFVAPSNQGRQMQNQFLAAMTPPQGSNQPSRSQFSEGYTAAIQVFAASNTYQLGGPQDLVGTRATQPSTKFVSPFSSLPIPVRMPWDL